MEFIQLEQQPNADELFDVLDEKGLPTGQSKRRAEVHRDGDWHRSFHLWIIKEGRYVLFQRRARNKDIEPFKLDVSVGGHFRSGETLPDVLREAKEEVGLVLRPSDVEYVETRQAVRQYSHALDREFQEVYVTRCDQALEDYFLDYREVYALHEIPLERAISLYRNGTPVAAAGWDAYQRHNNALLVSDDLISQAREDVIACLERLAQWLD